MKGVNGPQETHWIKMKCSSSNPETYLVGSGTGVVSISQRVHQRKDVLFVPSADGRVGEMPYFAGRISGIEKMGNSAMRKFSCCPA